MNSLFKIFEAEAIAAYWENVSIHMTDPEIGTKFFPATKQTGLELAWIKGRNGLPVALQPSAFDTKAPLRDRIGVSELSTEMPFFREASRLGEKDRQDIQTLLARGQKFAEPVITKVFDDAKRLIDGALVQSERMRMSLLYSGTIDITASEESGRTVAYNYNFDSEGTWAQKNNVVLVGNGQWTAGNASTSKPIDDINAAIEYLREYRGVQAVELLMNSTTLRGLLASESIVKAVNPVGYANMITTQKDLFSFVENKTDVKITLYDKRFIDEQGKDRKYYPDGYVTVLPSYSVGNTVYGTTPEEFDLLGGQSTDASVSIVNTGVAVTTIKEAHPVNVQTIVSEIVLPSFERMDDIYVLKVF